MLKFPLHKYCIENVQTYKTIITNGKTNFSKLEHAQFEILKKNLFSPDRTERKTTALLVIYLCYSDKKFAKMAIKHGLLIKIEDYYCISIAPEFSLEKKNNVLEVLKRDPEFMNNETRSNKLLVKHMPKRRQPTKGKASIATLTELRYYLRIDRYDRLPDPIQSVLWIFRKYEEKKVVSFKDCVNKKRIANGLKAKRKMRVRIRRRNKSATVSHNLEGSTITKASRTGASILEGRNRSYKIGRRSNSLKLKDARDNSDRKVRARRKVKIKTTPSFFISHSSISQFLNKDKSMGRRTSIDRILLKKQLTKHQIFAEEREYLRKEKIMKPKKSVTIHRRGNHSMNEVDGHRTEQKIEKKGYFFFKKMRRKRLQDAETNSN